MDKINDYKKESLNKFLLITAIVLVIIAVVITILYIVVKNNEDTGADYSDTIVGKNYFTAIYIDLSTKSVKRDNIDTTLQEEFGIGDNEANSLLNSTEDLHNFFANSTIDVNVENNSIQLQDKYQTKTIFLEADEVKDDFGAISSEKLMDGIFILKYDTEKRTRAAYEFFRTETWVKKAVLDQVSVIETINDESQTIYKDNEKNNNVNENSYGVSAMGLENYKKIVSDNGNPADVVVATIGYGGNIDNSYFDGRISDEYYNFIEDSKDVHETIAQGSRTLEVIKEGTSDNVKIMPLVVINDEYYTTTAAILKAILYATEKADVICYEFVQKQNEIIDLVLKNAFKEEVPVCCVTKEAVNENDDIYPANNGTTIAVSSVDKDLKTTSYSAKGDYLDFVASSTDVKEIFNSSSSVSMWSGPEYANAHIVDIIAMIKTYNKDFTLVEIYNMIRNYCKDLGDQGKDDIFGYGFPDFTGIKISDIDKHSPEIQEVNFDNDKWEKSKKIQIKATDNIKIYGWNITNSNTAPTEWTKIDGNSNNIDVSGDVNKNGTFYVWVSDSAGNIAYRTIEINKVDTTGPKLQYAIDSSKQATEKYVTITASAKDDESGLHDMPYSWDGQSWGNNNNTYKVTRNGTYKLYVRDKLGNTTERSITIKNFPEEGKADIDNGTIIKSISVSSDWNGNRNNRVTITINEDVSVEKWRVTESDEVPSDFQNNSSANNTDNSKSNENTLPSNDSLSGYANLTITVSLNAGTKYYFWVKDSDGDIVSQSFTIRK